MTTHRDYRDHDPDEQAAGRPAPDLDDLLRALPEDEARRLREVWQMAGPVEPGSFPAQADVEAAFSALQAAMERTDQRSPGRQLSSEDAEASARNTRARKAPSPDQLSAPRAACGARRPTKRSLVRRAGAVLGILCLLAAAGLYWWMLPVTQTAAPGERLTVTLPDGSAVELNSGSTLRRARRFGAERRVELEGEAFFDVQKSAKPFVVATFNAEVRVTGTQFAVRAWPSAEGETIVALTSGRVMVAPADTPAETVAMAPGETRRVASHRGKRPARVLPAALSVLEATAWRRGDLVFKDARLGIVLHDVERRFGIDLSAEPAMLRARRLNLALRQPEDAEAVVRDLTQALGLRYRATASGFEIYAPAP